MKKLIQLSFIFLLNFTVLVQAGTQVVMQEYKKGKPTQKSIMISVEDSLLRMDNQDSHSVVQPQMIFDVEKKTMLIIDHRDKTFSRMDEVFFKQVNQKIAAAKKQMDEQLAKMPEAQRKIMKGMMEKMMGGMSDQKKNITKFVNTSRTNKFNGHSCKITEYLVNGKKRREFCLTDTNKIQGSKAVLSAMKGMSKIFKEFYQSMESMLPMMMEENPFHELESLNGYPIAVTEFKNNKANESNQLKSIKSISFDKDFFEPPKGFKEKIIDMEMEH